MKREERKNMIEFIEKKKGIERDELLFMTDDEVEHIYNVTYFLYEEIAEQYNNPHLISNIRWGLFRYLFRYLQGGKIPLIKVSLYT